MVSSLSKGLKRWYPMTSADTASTVYDWSGNGKDLTNYNISINQTGHCNFLNRAVKSTSTNYYLEYAANNDIATDTTGTIAYWVNPGATVNVVGCELYKSDIGYLVFEVENNTPHFAGYKSGWSPDAYGSTGSVPTNTWTHIALTQTGSLYTIYVNGDYNTSASVDTWNNSFSGSTIRTRIFKAGYYGEARGSSDGYIQDFRYYDRALSANDIKRLYLNIGRLTNRSWEWY